MHEYHRLQQSPSTVRSYNCTSATISWPGLSLAMRMSSCTGRNPPAPSKRSTCSPWGHHSMAPLQSRHRTVRDMRGHHDRNAEVIVRSRAEQALHRKQVPFCHAGAPPDCTCVQLCRKLLLHNGILPPKIGITPILQPRWCGYSAPSKKA